MRLVQLIRDADLKSARKSTQTLSQIIEVRHINGYEFDIGGSRDSDVWKVVITKTTAECNCPSRLNRHTVCKHIVAAAAHLLSKHESTKDYSPTQWVAYAIGRHTSRQAAFYNYRPNVTPEVAEAFGVGFEESTVAHRKVLGYRLSDGRLWTGALPLPEPGERCFVHKGGRSWEGEILALGYSVPGYLTVFVITNELIPGYKTKRIVCFGNELEMMT